MELATTNSESEPSITTSRYKNGIWTNVGNLAEIRSHSGVVTLGSTIMIIGGTR